MYSYAYGAGGPVGAVSCGGGAGVVTRWAGVEGLEGSAVGVLAG